MIDAGRAGADHHLLVAHPDAAGDQRAQPLAAGTPDSGWPRRWTAISAERTAGSGGNGFSLSDNANGSTASGSAADGIGQSRLSVAISRDRPT